MHFRISLIVAGLALTAAAVSTAKVTKIASCTQPFNHQLYDCYDNGKLCPKLAGNPQKPCGDACYSPYQYACNDNRLQQLKAYDGRFQLVASNPQQLRPRNHSLAVQACGRHFWIQDGPACTYCPDVVKQQAGSCPNGKDTVFVGGSGMNTIVPGGQYYYVEPSGALGFTQAHSGSIPTGSISGVAVYENGTVLVVGLVNWLACPSTIPGKHYQIFAPLTGVKFDSKCIQVTLLVKAQSNDANIWQYV